MNANGSAQTRLTRNSVTDGAPVFSPDGKKIAFASTRNRNTDVYVMDADGTDEIRLTAHPAADGGPDWQPQSSPEWLLEENDRIASYGAWFWDYTDHRLSGGYEAYSALQGALHKNSV